MPDTAQQTLQVLHIAPRSRTLPELDWIAEISEVGQIDGVTIKPLGAEQATRQNISREARKQYGLVIWSGHGAPGGLVMPDDSVVRGDWLATQFNPDRVQAFILAACMSGVNDDTLESVASCISAAGITTIAFSCEIVDPAAARFCVEVVRAIAAGADVRTAKSVAAGEMAGIDHRSARGVMLLPGLSNGNRQLGGRMTKLEARVGALEEAVRSNNGRLDGKLDLLIELVKGRAIA